MSRSPLLGLLLASVALTSFPTTAQVEQVSLNFTKVELSYAPVTGHGIPFDLDFVVEADGSVEVRMPGVHKMHNVTLKRGVIGSAPASTWLNAAVVGDDSGAADAVLGDLMLEIPATDADGEVEFDGSTPEQDGRGPRLYVERAGLDTHLQVRFDPEAGIRLIGSPASLFNRPAVDQSLYAKLPIPRPGHTFETVLQVAEDARSSVAVMIRIRVKHPS